MYVAEQLRVVLEQSGLSNNAVIRATGIDRSSFYKILGGERRPTPEQITHILNAVRPEDGLRQQVMDAYERDRAGETVYHARQVVRRYINSLSDTEALRVGAAPDAALCDLVHESTAAGVAAYDVYLPVGSRCMTALFSLLSGDAVEYADDAAIEIRAIIDNEESADGGVSEDVFLELARWYAYLSHESIRFHAYTTRGETHGRTVLPYPYYILAGETLLLISRDELSYIAVQDPRLVAAYRENHAAQCAARQEIANTETGYAAILQFFIDLWRSWAGTPRTRSSPDAALESY